MNILTFDIEEWYTYELYPKGGRDYYLPIINNYLDNILDLLDEVDCKATFFCLGIIARNNPEVIRKIAARGHEIGCHSDKHIQVTKMTPAEFKADTHLAIKSIEDLIGKKVTYYRAPTFSITESNKWALEILIEEGITTDCSIFPSSRSFGGFPSFKENLPSIINVNGKSIREFPISYVTRFGKRWMFSGGGYFRLFPYPLIKKMMKETDYNMAYFHIRDLDNKQKEVYSLRYFQSYYGVKGAYVKFEQFLRENKFISLGEAINRTDWNNVSKVQLETGYENPGTLFRKPVAKEDLRDNTKPGLPVKTHENHSGSITDKKKSIVFINQNAGYLMIDIIHAFHGYEKKSIITGKLIERQTTLDKSVKVDKIIAYNRSSKFKRLFTWFLGFVQIVWIVKTRHRKSELFIVTNPPLNTFLPLLCKNKFSFLVFDVYPDALVSYNILKRESFFTRFWESTNRKIFARANKVFTIGNGMKTLLEKYTDSGKVNVVPLWTNNDFLKPVPKNENPFIIKHNLAGKFVVMYSGNMGHTHYVEILVELASVIKDPGIIFIAIGEGEKNQFINAMALTKELENFVLLPLQEASVLPLSLSAADVGVVTIDPEAGNLSIPSKTFNLMSVGVPLLCIADTGSELSRMVNNYNIGKCFLKTDIDQMASYIRLLKSDKEYQDGLKNNSLKASLDFTPENALKFAEA